MPPQVGAHASDRVVEPVLVSATRACGGNMGSRDTFANHPGNH